MQNQVCILGAGMTGLAAGWASGSPLYEAAAIPGGICSSYYVRPRDRIKAPRPPEDGEAYRFEVGGGHWIFGGDPAVLHFVRSIATVRAYERRSSVFFPDRELYVPYPLQNHLRYLGKDIAAKALTEMLAAPSGNPTTMAQAIDQNFGKTLNELFFAPFHKLYTAGLWDTVAPQDGYKTPVDMKLVVQGAFNQGPAVGYNATFLYPEEGLNSLAAQMAKLSTIHYEKSVVQIDVRRKEVIFGDGFGTHYDSLISTLSLDKMLKMTNLSVDEEPDPYTSVLVVNVGAKRGAKCPNDHWIYLPSSRSGFHRVGFYSNVNPSFLPRTSSGASDRVSIYVERAFQPNQKPSDSEIEAYSREVVRELQGWRFIEEVEVVDPTWIDNAYTWSLPGSQWRAKALRELEQHHVVMLGRYGRWVFQGIADSIRDGFFAGAAFRAK